MQRPQTQTRLDCVNCGACATHVAVPRSRFIKPLRLCRALAALDVQSKPSVLSSGDPLHLLGYDAPGRQPCAVANWPGLPRTCGFRLLVCLRAVRGKLCLSFPGRAFPGRVPLHSQVIRTRSGLCSCYHVRFACAQTSLHVVVAVQIQSFDAFLFAAVAAAAGRRQARCRSGAASSAGGAIELRTFRSRTGQSFVTFQPASGVYEEIQFVEICTSHSLETRTYRRPARSGWA